jgi:hypothetical protein
MRSRPRSPGGLASFDDAVWDNSVIVARGALIYSQTAGQRAVAVLDFGMDRTSNTVLFMCSFRRWEAPRR